MILGGWRDLWVSPPSLGVWMPAGSIEYAIATLFVIRFYAALRMGEALRFLVFALISVAILQWDYRALLWALVFDAVMVLSEQVLKALK